MEHLIRVKKGRHYITHRKVIDHYTGKYRSAAHSICNLRYETQREILVVLHNGSNYDFHVIIKELPKTLRKNMKRVGENTENDISFSVLMNTANDNGEKSVYKLKFIDSMRFMNTSLANLTDSLSELNRQECKNCQKTGNVPNKKVMC